MKTAFDPDKIGMSNRNHVSKVCFEMLDRVQTETPEVQMLAVATLFAAICQRHNHDAWPEFSRAKRILSPEPFDRTGNERYRALLDYAGSELKKP